MITTANKNLKGLLFTFCMVLMTVFLTQTSVYALTRSGNVSDGKGIKITKANTIVDSITFNGTTVNAIYKPKKGVSNYNSDSTYCCAAFVSRFYKQVYGITVNNLYPGNTPNVASGTGRFVKTSSPKVGDIYGNSGHWAIVKAVSGNNLQRKKSDLQSNCII